MNNTNTVSFSQFVAPSMTVAAVESAILAFEHSLIGFDPGLAREFATGLRSCATWREAGEVLAFYYRVLRERVGAAAVFVCDPLPGWQSSSWDLVHVARDLSYLAEEITGPAPRPAQGELF